MRQQEEFFGYPQKVFHERPSMLPRGVGVVVVVDVVEAVRRFISGLDEEGVFEVYLQDDEALPSTEEPKNAVP